MPTVPAPFDVTLFVWLLLVASLVAMAAARFKLPYALALVCTGLVVGGLEFLPPW